MTAMRIHLLTAVLVAAALAGCTAGDEDPATTPAPTFRQAPQDDSRGVDRDEDDENGTDGWRGDLRLEVDPKRGPVPLNVTIQYDVGGREGSGQGKGLPAGNGTAGNGTAGNRTAGNATSGESSDANANLTWTLRMWRMAPDEVEEMEAEEAANATAGGNGTAGNGTSSTSPTGGPTGNSTGTTTGSPGNSTGPTTSWTGTSTGSMPDNETGVPGNGTGPPSGPGNLTLTINGTWADLPGATSHLINATGHYKVRFEVDYGNGTLHKRTAVVHARDYEEGEALGNETRTFEGSFLASDPLFCLTGAEEFDWRLNATFGPHGATVSRLNATLESDGSLDGYEMFLVAPNGTEIASGESLDVEGPLGAGNYTLRVESCLAFDTSFVVTGIADYAFTRTPKAAPVDTEDDG